MGVYIKGMKMPKECGECKWFHFHGETCTTPKYYLDSRCELVKSGKDWYGKDSRGGWIGKSISHLPGYGDRYTDEHCVEIGSRASVCPLVEVPEPHGRLIDADELWNKMSNYTDNEGAKFPFGDDDSIIHRDCIDLPRAKHWDGHTEADAETRLMSLEPERKKGRWIVIVKGCKLTSYKCSECGRYIADDTGYDVKKDYPFCHCGADMREDADE